MTWIETKKRKPKSPRSAYGVPVIVYQPSGNHYKTSDCRTVFEAFFGGMRYGREFYLYGATISEVTHWMPMPEVPGVITTDRKSAR